MGVIEDIFLRISYSWAIILVSFALETLFTFLIKPGSGVITAGIRSQGGLISKRKGFVIFLAVTLGFGILDPSGIITWLQKLIYSDGNLFGGFGLALLACLIVAWIYFNKKADLNPLSLGGKK